MQRPALAILILLALLGVLLGTGYVVAYHYHTARLAAKVDKPSGPIPVVVTTPKPGVVEETAMLSGTLAASSDVVVVARSAGEITAKHVSIGDRVKTGQLLYEIDKETYEAGLAQAEAGVAQANAAVSRARAAFEQAQTEYERAKRLYQAGSATRQMLDNAESGYRQAKAGLQQAEAAAQQAAAAHELARIALKYCYVESPIDGHIADDFRVDEGDSVGQGMPVARIVARDTLKAVASLPGKFLHLVKAGNSKAYIEVEGYSGRIAATVTTVNPAVDPMKRAADIECHFENPKDENGRPMLSPGRFARVHVVLRSESGLVVPASALCKDCTIPAVIVIDENNTMRPTHIKTGLTTSTQSVIREGLTGNERIMSEGVLASYKGGRVVVVEEKTQTEKEE